MHSLQTIAAEIAVAYPNSQYEPGKDSLSGKVTGPSGSFVLSQTDGNFYVVRLGNGRQMNVHHYKPESDLRDEHLRGFVGKFV